MSRRRFDRAAFEARLSELQRTYLDRIAAADRWLENAITEPGPELRGHPVYDHHVGAVDAARDALLRHLATEPAHAERDVNDRGRGWFSAHAQARPARIETRTRFHDPRRR